jgi:hypothetical protein
MNQLKITSMLVYAAITFFLTSCGGGRREENTTDTTGTDSVAVNTAAPAGTIDTTPQSMMISRHKVADFSKWQTVYDEHDSVRLANGIHNYVIGRGMEDSNMVLVAVKVDDMARAKAFSKDASLKKAMQQGGVTGTPNFSFVTLTFQDTAVIESDIRAISMLTVKDWDAWRKAFEEGRQERMDNGLVARAYGYDADDNHKVTLVTAVTDTAKAHAYWKSDMLKQRREAAGVTGEPKRFVFRVVKRY